MEEYVGRVNPLYKSKYVCTGVIAAWDAPERSGKVLVAQIQEKDYLILCLKQESCFPVSGFFEKDIDALKEAESFAAVLHAKRIG